MIHFRSMVVEDACSRKVLARTPETREKIFDINRYDFKTNDSLYMKWGLVLDLLFCYNWPTVAVNFTIQVFDVTHFSVI